MNAIQLTKELKAFAQDQEIDIFGISGVAMINQHARPGRRPRDLYPSAKSVLIFGCGMADPFSRGWVYNGRGGAYFSLTSSELDNRKWKLIRFLRQHGFQSFGGEMHGGGMLASGLRMANIAESIGIGYIGKSNLLITEKYGPRLNLHFVTTDAPLIPDEKKVDNQCGSCRICQEFCSSGAIIAAHSIEKCNRCMACCPIGEKTIWE